MNAAPDEAEREGEWRSALTLAAGVLIAVALLGTMRSLTSERAARAETARLTESLAAVLSGVPFDNAPATDRLLVRDESLGSPDPLSVYRARLGERPAAAVLSVVAPQGYGGAIEMLVGVRADGRVTAVRVVAHRETPGIGDRVERRRSDWITRFAGHSLGLAHIAAGTRAERHDGMHAERHDEARTEQLDGSPRDRSWRLARDGGRFDALTSGR